MVSKWYNSTTMKKKAILILTILLLTICLSVLTACSQYNNPNNPDDKDKQPSDNNNNAGNNPGEKPDDYDNKDDEPKERYTKVVIISGQSNAIGFSDRKQLQGKISDERYQKLYNPVQNVKMISEVGKNIVDYDNITIDTFVNVTLGGGGLVSFETDSFGPEVGIAETLSQKYSNENIYIIKCAFGGASLFRDFQSPSMAEEMSYDYKLLTDLIDKSMQALKDAQLNPKIVGFCWMQGEADASADMRSDGHQYRYFDNLTKFVGDLRAKYNQDSLGGEMNFIDAYIHEYFEFYKIVNEQKLQFSKVSNCNHIINTMQPNLVVDGIMGLTAKQEPSVSIGPIDPLHYDSTSTLKLGNMFGEAIISIVE